MECDKLVYWNNHRTADEQRLEGIICLRCCSPRLSEGRQGWPVNAKILTSECPLVHTFDFLPPKSTSCPARTGAIARSEALLADCIAHAALIK